MGHHLGESLAVFGQLDADRRQLDDIGPEIAQGLAQLARLLARARHDNALAKQRTLFKPVDLFTLFDDIADHCHRGRREIFCLGNVGDRFKRANDRLLRTGRRPTRQRNRRLRRCAVLDEGSGDLTQPRHTHQKHLRARRLGQLRVIDRTVTLRRVLVTGENRQLRVVIAMGHRNARIGGSGNRRADARHDLKRHTCRSKLGGLFATTGKNHRIPTLEPHHRFPSLGLLDDERVDLILRHGVILRALADMNLHAAGLGPVDQLGITKGIVDQHIGIFDALFGTKRHQAEVTRTPTHQITNSGIFHFNDWNKALATSRGSLPLASPDFGSPPVSGNTKALR